MERIQCGQLALGRLAGFLAGQQCGCTLVSAVGQSTAAKQWMPVNFGHPCAVICIAATLSAMTAAVWDPRSKRWGGWKETHSPPQAGRAPLQEFSLGVV